MEKPSRLKSRTSYSKQDFSFFAHTHALQDPPSLVRRYCEVVTAVACSNLKSLSVHHTKDFWLISDSWLISSSDLARQTWLIVRGASDSARQTRLIRLSVSDLAHQTWLIRLGSSVSARQTWISIFIRIGSSDLDPDLHQTRLIRHCE